MSSASKIVFYRCLHASAKAGLPPGAAVELANEACEQEPSVLGPRLLRLFEIVGGTRAPALGVSWSTLRDIAGRLRGGCAFSQALGRHPDEFPAWETAIVGVGEKTGRLDQTFRFIEEILERRRAVLLASAAKSAGPLAAQMMIPWIVWAPIAYLAGWAIYLGAVAVSYFVLTPGLLSRGGASFKASDSRAFAKMLFAQCLSWLIGAGVSVDESVGLAALAAGLPSSDARAPSETMPARLRGCGLFSNEELACVEVAEFSGKLDTGLEALAKEARRTWDSAQATELGQSSLI